MRKVVAALCAFVVVVLAAPAVRAYEIDPTVHNPRTGVAVYHPNGRWSGSPDALEPRPALSLAKLYLGYYVLYNGTKEEKALVKDMVRRSSDVYASQLDAAYPEAIDQIAKDFSLPNTTRNGAWGNTMTAPYDMSKFIASILWDPKAKPLFDGMKSVSPTAEDDFPQVFGTAKLDDVIGFKTGWSNDKVSETGSVAYGETGDTIWVATALTWGDAYDNTADAVRALKRADECRHRFFAPCRAARAASENDRLNYTFTRLPR